jgi:hypothetical protein
MKSKTLVVVAFAVWAAAGPAVASPITYMDYGIGSGTLDGTSFTNSLVEVSFTGDTSTIINDSSGFYSNRTGIGSVRVAGVGTDTFLNAFAFSNQNLAIAGIASSNGSILDTVASPFNTYALGPIGPTSGGVFFRSDLTYATLLGSFHLSSFGETTTFTTESVPVPLPVLGGGLPGLILGGGGLLGWWRRKRKAEATA